MEDKKLINEKDLEKVTGGSDVSDNYVTTDGINEKGLKIEDLNDGKIHGRIIFKGNHELEFSR